jgi:hypothetical protein
MIQNIGIEPLQSLSETRKSLSETRKGKGGKLKQSLFPSTKECINSLVFYSDGELAFLLDVLTKSIELTRENQKITEW